MSLAMIPEIDHCYCFGVAVVADMMEAVRRKIVIGIGAGTEG